MDGSERSEGQGGRLARPLRGFWGGIGRVQAIAPGCYVDEQRNVHLDLGEILEAKGHEDTPDNRARMIQQIQRSTAPALPAPA